MSKHNVSLSLQAENSLLSFQQTRRAEGLFGVSIEKGFSCENESSSGGVFSLICT